MYNALISYSHFTDDKFAPALQNALQKFAKPGIDFPDDGPVLMPHVRRSFRLRRNGGKSSDLRIIKK